MMIPYIIEYKEANLNNILGHINLKKLELIGEHIYLYFDKDLSDDEIRLIRK